MHEVGISRVGQNEPIEAGDVRFNKDVEVTGPIGPVGLQAMNQRSQDCNRDSFLHVKRPRHMFPERSVGSCHCRDHTDSLDCLSEKRLIVLFPKAYRCPRQSPQAFPYLQEIIGHGEPSLANQSVVAKSL